MLYEKIYIGKGKCCFYRKASCTIRRNDKCFNCFFEKSRIVKNAYLAWKVDDRGTGYLLVIDSDE